MTQPHFDYGRISISQGRCEGLPARCADPPLVQNPGQALKIRSARYLSNGVGGTKPLASFYVLLITCRGRGRLLLGFVELVWFVCVVLCCCRCCCALDRSPRTFPQRRSCRLLSPEDTVVYWLRASYRAQQWHKEGCGDTVTLMSINPVWSHPRKAGSHPPIHRPRDVTMMMDSLAPVLAGTTWLVRQGFMFCLYCNPLGLDPNSVVRTYVVAYVTL